MTTARGVALEALVRVEAGAYSNVLLPSLLRDARLSARDRGQATDLVYGTLRRQRALDHLLDFALDRPLTEVDAPVRAALRLGTYQLVEGVPAHAAVGETVDAIATVQPRAKGFVNAVLRGVAALGPPWPWPEGEGVPALGVRWSMPDWIVERLIADLGRADALAALEVANVPAALTLRANPLRTTVDDLAEELTAVGAAVEPGALVPGALVVRGGGDPSRLPAVAQGRATPQDAASQAVVAAVGAQAGERVLDVASAPGGKATGIAEAMLDAGLVVAADVHAARLGLVARATARLALRSVVPIVTDGRSLPLPVASFDRVLVDAPCSGLGVLRRRPEARWSIRPEAITELATLQRELLAAAADTVRPGGRLVYSVCTLTAAETTEVDEWTASALGGFAAEPPPGGPWQPRGRGALLLPHAAGTDGMYVLVLRRGPSASAL